VPTLSAGGLEHKAKKGGFRAAVPALPGRISQSAATDGLLANVREAVHAWLATELPVEAGGLIGERRRLAQLRL
jgi:predicted RNase H-like HicB family nuclease